ncbi:hypothetical protein [Spiroplasma endosymbiont of Aspidapion aeneum]|uniref:hypothetical protein n=1 Tax=Spiroplasma endosymbiont of Aspidapion aeneum TaxID=3066276 RepID=UPI00313AC921
MESSKGQFNFYKNSLSVLYWIKDLQVSLFGDILTGDLKFKNIQSWYTFQLTLLLVSGQLNLFDQNKIAIFANLYTNFNLIIDVCLSASLVLCATWAMGRKTNKIQLVIFTAINALCLCCLKYVLVRDNFTIWNEESYFVYLVAFIIFILYDYVVTVERAKNQPLLIGLILSSYIAFSWVLSYQILFLIYSILFILQIWLRNIFVKELYKISLLFGVDFIFFNIIEKLYLLSLIYAGVILLFSLILYLMNKNYNIVINFETALNNRREFSILAIPIIIIVASLFIGLMQKSNDLFLLSSQGVFLLYPLFELLFNTNKLLYTVVFSYVLLIASVIWIFYRHNKVFGRVKMPIDILAINFLTFYNPYAVRTLKTLVYINLEMSNVAILIISLYVIILWVLNKIHNQFFSFIKIKSIRKKQIIYNIEVRKY